MGIGAKCGTKKKLYYAFCLGVMMRVKGIHTPMAISTYPHARTLATPCGIGQTHTHTTMHQGNAFTWLQGAQG